MARIELPPLALPVPAERLYAFLSDLSKHQAFLEPDAFDFSGDADSHRYKLDIMGMKTGLEWRIHERTEPSRVVLSAGDRKIFDQRLRYEIAPGPEAGCTLRLSDEADIPMMMAMMGAEKLLEGQLERTLDRLAELAGSGRI